MNNDNKQQMIENLMSYELTWFKENGKDEDVDYLIDYFKDLLLYCSDEDLRKLYKNKFSEVTA